MSTSESDKKFFRIKLGAIKVRSGGALAPAWLYQRPGGVETLQITAIQTAGVVLPDFSAHTTLDRLKPMFEHAELEAATFAEWIDQGGTPLEKLEPARHDGK